jgi:hypothetical protein
MAADAALLGLAIVLTLAAGLGIARYESFAIGRAWRVRGPSRPGAVALLIGFGLAALVTGKLAGNLFLVPAEAVAAVSGLRILRRGGRITSFAILWASAAVVVVALGAEIPAFGRTWADIAWTALLLACFCGLLRELDVTGSAGWFVALVTAGATAGVCYALDRSDDATVAVLLTGAVFAIIASAPFGAGLLGRVGSRFLGLAIGGVAIRAAVGSPRVMVAVAGVGVVCALAYIATLDSPARGRANIGLVAVAVVLAVAAVPAARALLAERSRLQTAVHTSRDLVRTRPRRGLESVSADLASIETTFRASHRRLSTKAVRAGSVVPFLGANLRAAESSADVAADLAASARRLVDEITVKNVAMRNGKVERADLERLDRGLQVVLVDLKLAIRRMHSAEADELLVPELRDGVHDLVRQVHSVTRRAETSLEGTRAAIQLLGFDRPRRYFVAVQNNAESRATGGYIANYGILAAVNGSVTLPEFRRTSEFDADTAVARTLNAPKEYRRRYSRFDVSREWTNVNMSPDLPTVARVMADQYRQFSRTRIDGVIAIDPVALAHLLTLTGPVSVPGWPTPITAGNVVKVALHDEYIVYDNQGDNRIDFLGRVAKTVFDRLSNGGLADLIRAGGVVHDATASRHLQLWAADPGVQEFFGRVDADGALPPPRGDALMVTTQNAAGNKLDYYLHRDVTYDAAVEPDGDGLRVEATMTVKLRNDAPAAGEPRYVIGPFDGRFKAGQNRLFLTAYSPLRVDSATLDGQRLEIDGAAELGRLAHSAFIDVPAASTRTVVLKLSGRVRGGADYRFDVVRQPLVYDDTLTVHVRGLRHELRWSGTISHDLHLLAAVSSP